MNSAIRESPKGDLLQLKVYRTGKKQTEFYVSSWKKNGEMTDPEKKTFDDLKSLTSFTKNTYILPIVEIRGGVYFFNNTFGTSLAAKRLLVIKGDVEESSSSFEFGNVKVNKIEGDVEVMDEDDDYGNEP